MVNTMIADGELLKRYVRDNSEDSFSELVHLRAGFVYATALRRVGRDAHLANDVTQQVFVALARNASRLVQHPALSGWLYLTTRNIAAQLVRTEYRRKNREKESALMRETFAAIEPPPEDAPFRDNLDAVLDELNERDRHAVLLRFFEGCSFAEIAARAQLNENAARMRVERALEKLRIAFSKRGITSTAAILGARLTAHASMTLPVTLTTTLAHTALASAGVGAGTLGITFMSLTKLQTGIAIIAVALGVGGIVFHQRGTAELHRQIDQLAAQNGHLLELQNENSRLKQTAVIRSHSDTDRNISAAPEKTADPLRVVSGSKSPSKPSPVALAAGLMPVQNLDHTNRASARAAFSTQIWAAAEGDVDLEQSSILLRPEAREKLQDLLATLPESAHENYGTPERLMASVLAGSPHPVGGMQILNEKPESDNRVVLETQWQHADDTVVHHSNVELQRDDAGTWRMVVPMVLVDRAVAYLNSNFHSPPPVQKNQAAGD